jgi:hypothetical protein
VHGLGLRLDPLELEVPRRANSRRRLAFKSYRRKLCDSPACLFVGEALHSFGKELQREPLTNKRPDPPRFGRRLAGMYLVQMFVRQRAAGLGICLKRSRYPSEVTSVSSTDVDRRR